MKNSYLVLICALLLGMPLAVPVSAQHTYQFTVNPAGAGDAGLTHDGTAINAGIRLLPETSDGVARWDGTNWVPVPGVSEGNDYNIYNFDIQNGITITVPDAHPNTAAIVTNDHTGRFTAGDTDIKIESANNANNLYGFLYVGNASNAFDGEMTIRNITATAAMTGTGSGGAAGFAVWNNAAVGKAITINSISAEGAWAVGAHFTGNVTGSVTITEKVEVISRQHEAHGLLVGEFAANPADNTIANVSGDVTVGTITVTGTTAGNVRGVAVTGDVGGAGVEITTGNITVKNDGAVNPESGEDEIHTGNVFGWQTFGDILGGTVITLGNIDATAAMKGTAGAAGFAHYGAVTSRIVTEGDNDVETTSITLGNITAKGNWAAGAHVAGNVDGNLTIGNIIATSGDHEAHGLLLQGTTNSGTITVGAITVKSDEAGWKPTTGEHTPANGGVGANAFGIRSSGTSNLHLTGNITVTGTGGETSGIRTHGDTNITLGSNVVIKTTYEGTNTWTEENPTGTRWVGADIWANGHLNVDLAGHSLTTSSVKVENNRNEGSHVTIKGGGTGNNASRANLGTVTFLPNYPDTVSGNFVADFDGAATFEAKEITGAQNVTITLADSSKFTLNNAVPTTGVPVPPSVTNAMFYSPGNGTRNDGRIVAGGTVTFNQSGTSESKLAAIDTKGPVSITLANTSKMIIENKVETTFPFNTMFGVPNQSPANRTIDEGSITTQSNVTLNLSGGSEMQVARIEARNVDITLNSGSNLTVAGIEELRVPNPFGSSTAPVIPTFNNHGRIVAEENVNVSITGAQTEATIASIEAKGTGKVTITLDQGGNLAIESNRVSGTTVTNQGSISGHTITVTGNGTADLNSVHPVSIFTIEKDAIVSINFTDSITGTHNLRSSTNTIRDAALTLYGNSPRLPTDGDGNPTWHHAYARFILEDGGDVEIDRENFTTGPDHTFEIEYATSTAGVRTATVFIRLIDLVASDGFLAATQIRDRYTGYNMVRDRFISADPFQHADTYWGQAPPRFRNPTQFFRPGVLNNNATWANVVHRTDSYRGWSGGNAWKINSEGVQVGTDLIRTRYEQLGMIFGTEKGKATNLGDRVDSKDMYAGVYAARVFNNGWDFRLLYNYGWQQFDMVRHRADLRFTGDRYTSDFSGSTHEFTFEFGERHHLGAWSIRPFCGIDVFHNRLSGAQESGVGTGTQYYTTNYGKLNRTETFLRSGYDLRFQSGRFTLNSGLSFAYELGGQQFQMSRTDIDGSRMQRGNAGRQLFAFNAGGTIDITRNLALFGGYNIQTMLDRHGYQGAGQIGGLWTW